MTYRTINLSAQTYERLSMYKVGQRTYDEVICELMDEVAPEKFYERELAEHYRRLDEMEREGIAVSMSQARKVIDEA